ncbi:ATP-binding protein [Roseateles sp.]|uniref:ATP-binding protein n=1 Tax=Roseateles sp. TaxID=1971397 RepID=UPI0037C91619
MRALRLRHSMTLLLLLAVTVIFGLVGAVLLLYRLPQVEERTRVQLQERASTAERVLDHYSIAVEAQLKGVASATDRLPQGQLQPLVQSLVNGADMLDGLYVLDARDHVLALGLHERTRSAGASMIGLDLSSNALVRRLRAQPASEVLWSDEYLSVLAGRNTVALGLRAGEHIVIFELAPARLLDIITAVQPATSFQLLVVDSGGRFLAASELHESSARFANYALSPAVQAALSAQPLPMGHELLDGKKVAVGAARSAKLGWVVLAFSTTGLGEYTYRTTVMLVGGGLLAVVLLALLMAPLWAGRMARPMHAVIRRVSAFSKGDAHSAWPTSTGVIELNQLAHEVEQMAAQVHSREQDVRRGAERLRATLESVPSIAIQWYDREGRIHYWNPASEAMYGFTAEQALGLTVREAPLMYVDAEQVAALCKILDDIDRGGGAFGPAEFKLRHADGRYIDVLATLFAIPADDGSRLIACMDVDVTARNAALASLAAIEQRQELIFSASPIALSVGNANDDFRVTSVNAAWERLLKRSADEVRGRNGRDFGLWADPADRQRFLDQLDSHRKDVSMEAELLDGRGRKVLCRISARLASIGSERLLLMALEDIREQRQAEEEIRQLNTQLEQRVVDRTAELSLANAELARNLETLTCTQQQLVQAEKLAALGKLVAGVAHELNTPIGNGLMAISTLADHTDQIKAALRGGLKRSTLEDFVAAVDQGQQIVLRNLTRAAELVTSFKQVAVDQSTAQRRQFDLAALVDEIMLTLRPSFKRTPYIITSSCPPGLKLDSYPGPLGQVLTNLINNAVIHGFDERDHGRIEVRCEALPGDQLRLSVSDDGQGIPEKALASVFDPFFTTRMGRGGTGLGLHISHSLVTHVLGGSIKVESRVGEGTTVSIELPRVAPMPG